MKRREFITAAALVVLDAFPAEADRLKLIGWFMGIADDSEGQARLFEFREALNQLGWREGTNYRLELRWGSGDSELIRSFAVDFASLDPDVILANGAPVMAALQRATSKTPVVFVQLTDPVEAGFVRSLRQPGGNITGFTHFEYSVGAKWLQVLKELAPATSRVGVMQNPSNPDWPRYWRAVASGASTLALSMIPAHVDHHSKIRPVIRDLASEPDTALVVLPDTITSVYRDEIIDAAAQYRLPAVYPLRFFALSGGLVSYGVDHLDLYRRAASYVDRILEGASPGDLPVQQPTKFHLVINAKAAKALGLTIPPTLLARADEVIE